MIFDYVVIGGGVIGTAIFNKLVRKGKTCALLEREPDLATGATKANSGLIHAGFDAESGSLKAKFNVRGNELTENLAKELKVPFKRTGAVVVGNDLEKLKALLERGEKNGVRGLEIVEGDKLKSLVPNLKEDIKYALYAPSAGLISPYMFAIALAEEGVINGGVCKLNFEIDRVEQTDGVFEIFGNNEVIQARKAINSAGAGFNEVSKLFKTEEFPIKFRRGEYIVLDKSDFVKLSVFPLPTALGKGILATPTVDGNILLGPTAEDIETFNTETTECGIDKIISYINSTFNNVPLNKNIRQFSGIRVSCGEDFVVKESTLNPNVILIAGINSPGLSSAPAIAEYVVEELLKEHSEDKPMIARKGYTCEPAGKIICKCEKVGEKEIENAINAPIPATTVDAVKRRVRAGMGRCQGGQCMLDICKLIAKNLNIELEDVKKESAKSNIMFKGGF